MRVIKSGKIKCFVGTCPRCSGITEFLLGDGINGANGAFYFICPTYGCNYKLFKNSTNIRPGKAGELIGNKDS